jgi:divalent metal cation (Fe/Co/Zn/Cd) transporter
VELLEKESLILTRIDIQGQLIDVKTESASLLKQGLWVEYASLAWMVVEGIVALYSGIAAWSLALLAFGGDSVVELLSSVAVVRHLRLMSNGPASSVHVDSERTEWVTALLLVSLLPVIGLGAVYSIVSDVQPESSPLGIIVAFAAVLIMPILWSQKRRIGRASGCLPLIIDATESATCFLMSIALLLGLVINYLLKLFWADYVASLIILIFVAREAMESIREVKAKRGQTLEA